MSHFFIDIGHYPPYYYTHQSVALFWDDDTPRRMFWIRSDIHGKKCHPLDSSFLLGWVQIWDNVAPGGRSQITNFVVLARRSISTTHRVLVAEERRDQVVQHFKYNHMVFFVMFTRLLLGLLFSISWKKSCKKHVVQCNDTMFIDQRQQR